MINWISPKPFVKWLILRSNWNVALPNQSGGWFKNGRYMFPPSLPPSLVFYLQVSSTRSPDGDKHLDRSIWSPPLCWQTSFLSAPAWPSGSQKQTWTPQRSTKKERRKLQWRRVRVCVIQPFSGSNAAVPTLPVPGTSRPSTGRGISMLLTAPYLLHSSRTSSTISSYSSSSSSSSGATMFIRHSTSVGKPPIWVTELFRPGTCSVTGVWFILVCKDRRDGENRVNATLYVTTCRVFWL